MKKMVCFALVLILSSLTWASRSEKLKRNIQKRELKREIAQEKKKENHAKKDL